MQNEAWVRQVRKLRKRRGLWFERQRCVRTFARPGQIPGLLGPFHQQRLQIKCTHAKLSEPLGFHASSAGKVHLWPENVGTFLTLEPAEALAIGPGTFSDGPHFVSLVLGTGRVRTAGRDNAGQVSEDLIIWALWGTITPSGPVYLLRETIVPTKRACFFRLVRQ